jgi:hypothetical protein
MPDDPPKSNPRQPLPAYPLPKRPTTPPWRKSYRYRSRNTPWSPQ